MTTWDYTLLAPTYSLRPPYAERAVERIVETCGVSRPRVADIGAGTGHLTLDLLRHGCSVDAVEPNDAMRSIGQERTSGRAAVRWYRGTAERSGLPTGAHDLVTFGSSFNTTDTGPALAEAARMLTGRGWMACVWNHRRLDDPLQASIEALIRSRVPEYSYGSRRADQSPAIEASGLFSPATKIEESFHHEMPTADWTAAWRSHATLQRQAGPLFDSVVADIEALVRERVGDTVRVPYVTVGWLAPRRRTD
ncbi:class I SAM-dependent methyltransferase [Streptomyces sp. DT24]|uniref:class I SAM-dependent methyltransferase n=1 Tax=unclassified Streptomyces TaxID=2593676 RepID=UPI003CFAF862